MCPLQPSTTTASLQDVSKNMGKTALKRHKTAKPKTTTRKDTLQPPAVQKPRPDFPLTPHWAFGQWCKKIKGRVRYLGKLDDPEAAEKRYLAERDELTAGRVPRPAEVTTGRVDVAFACNAFLHAKRCRVDSGEITERTWQELKVTCEGITGAFGRYRLVSELRGGRTLTTCDRSSPRKTGRCGWQRSPASAIGFQVCPSGRADRTAGSV